MLDFKTWIKYFENVDRYIGDLAKEIGQDDTFPITKDYDVILDYFNRRDVRNEVEDTFEYVYRFYIDDNKY